MEREALHVHRFAYHGSKNRGSFDTSPPPPQNSPPPDPPPRLSKTLTTAARPERPTPPSHPDHNQPSFPHSRRGTVNPTDGRYSANDPNYPRRAMGSRKSPHMAARRRRHDRIRSRELGTELWRSGNRKACYVLPEKNLGLSRHTIRRPTTAESLASPNCQTDSLDARQWCQNVASTGAACQ